MTSSSPFPISFAELLEAIPDPLLMAGPDGRILGFNSAAEQLSGYNAAELAALRIEDLVGPKQRAGHRAKREAFQAAGGHRRPMGAGLKIELLRKDGTLVPVDIALAPLDVAGPGAVVATIRDITQRRQVEARLAEQALLLERAHDAILVRRAHDGAITYWNQGAIDLYGHSREDALGRVAQDLLVTRFPHGIDEVLDAVEREGHWEGQLQQSRADGTRLTVSSRWVMMRSEDGLFPAILEINRDVTDEKLMYEQLAVVADRERLARQLHDGVIQALFGVGLSLQAGASVTQDAELRERIDDAITELDRVTRDLRGFIFDLRQPRGRGLAEVLEELGDRVSGQSGLVVVVAVDDRMPALPPATVQEITLFAQEALANAVRHGAAKSARLSAGMNGERLYFEVEDDGRGFDPAQPAGGNGLRNLRERAVALGGSLDVVSSPGDGSRLTLRIPIARG